MGMAGPTGEARWRAEVAAGDQRAAAALYDAYAGPLYGFGLQRLGDRELAEELVQRVLLTLCRRADRYDPERGPVRAYVFAIAAQFQLFAAVSVIAFLQLGLYTRARLVGGMLALVPVALVLPIGIWLGRRLDRGWFDRAVLAVLTVMGVGLLLDGLRG
jgi:hypothetical protein